MVSNCKSKNKSFIGNLTSPSETFTGTYAPTYILSINGSWNETSKLHGTFHNVHCAYHE